MSFIIKISALCLCDQFALETPNGFVCGFRCNDLRERFFATFYHAVQPLNGNLHSIRELKIYVCLFLGCPSDTNEKKLK